MRALLIIAGTALTISTASAEGPVQVQAPVEKVFAPLGFDDNDDAELVLHGHFPNTCYKVGPATATTDVAARTITIDAKAWRYPGAVCAMVMVPFIQSVKLGPIPAGDYQIKVLDRPGAETLPLNIVQARTRNPDDYIYAPVDSISIEKDQAGQRKIVLEGNYPYTFIGCMKIVEVRERVTPGRVIVVQPIAELFENDEDCVDQADSKKFRVEQPLTDASEAAEYLAHVRVLEGQSLNRMFDLSE
jgi:hypothetical protein